jgi:hypothetical protein
MISVAVRLYPLGGTLSGGGGGSEWAAEAEPSTPCSNDSLDS